VLVVLVDMELMAAVLMFNVLTQLLPNAHVLFSQVTKGDLTRPISSCSNAFHAACSIARKVMPLG
jgi:hypothetical protein